MRRAATLAVALTAAMGAALAAVAGATDERGRAFDLGVKPDAVATVVRPGQEGCQRGVVTEASFDRVELLYGTYGLPGPRLALRVADARGGKTLARGSLPAGYPDNTGSQARVEPEVGGDRVVDVCVRNVGQRRVALYGGDPRDAIGHATRDDRRVARDLWMRFHRSDPEPALALVPLMFERASVFRPDPIGAWTFWLVLAAVVAGIPALLALALRTVLGAAHDEGGT